MARMSISRHTSFRRPTLPAWRERGGYVNVLEVSDMDTVKALQEAIAAREATVMVLKFDSGK